MADEGPDRNGADEAPGVFGNLPSTRPGMRSPRRAGDADKTDAATRSQPEKPQRPTPPPAAPAPESPPEPPPGAEREPATPAPGTAPRITSVEDLAWAGVAVAAQAATVGVRFASRALDAARKSIDRP
jgi:hypothetical protein